MELGEIKEKLSKDIEKLGYHLYSLKYLKKDKILEVLIDESIDLNEVSLLSEKISKIMDKYDEDFDEYLLDVASAGCEREIKSEDDIKKAVNSYVHVKTNEQEIEGTLSSYKDGVLTIDYLDKTRKKTIKINTNDVKKLRYAVKF
ncbi:MAG: hypothetical protein Q4F12_00130 [Erysipelotrichaceae bacterium]|nr:hypothetical protein [Erysipelotrichaceae bacterium]